MFSTVTVPVYTPMFPYPCQHLSSLLLLIITIWQVWSDILLWFWFAFPWWILIWGTFLHTCWRFLWPLWKNIYAACLPIFKSDCFFPLSCIISVSIWILIFYQMCGSYLWFIDIISYSIGCLFISFYCTEAVQFDIVPPVNFWLCSLCFCVISKNPCHNQCLGTFTLGFLLGVLCFQALNLSSYSISG